MNAQTQNTRPSPFRGILPFRYADRRNFFGREKEISELAAKIMLYRLVVLFGDSGAGKSSLINAGIVPRLESEGFQPEGLRVRPFKESPFLVERISSGRQDSRFLPSVFADFARESSSDSREIYCSIGGFEEALLQAKPKSPLVIILDQFEEVFTLFESANRDLQQRILAAIANAANRKDLAAKIVLGIREDFLGKLEFISKEYPQVFDRRVRLDLLDQKSAKRAVIGPFEQKGEFASEITAEAADAIIADFEKGTEGEGIHPTQLQIVCSRLWDEYSDKHPVITCDYFLEMGMIKGILEGFLGSTVAALSTAQKDLAYRVLGQLITASGTRDVVSEAKLEDWYAQAAAGDETSFDEVLGILEEKRLINRTSKHDLYYFEVSSEYLVTPIKQYNRLREFREAERKAAEAAAKAANEAAQLRELDQAHQLAAEQMRVAEAERQRAEIKARAAKRLRRRSTVLAIVAIFLVFAMIGAYIENTRAQKAIAEAKRIAEIAKSRAAELEQKNAELKKANEDAVTSWQDALAANLRLTEIQKRMPMGKTKIPIEFITDSARIKEEAFSKDPDRLRNILEQCPSRIVFDVDMKEIGSNAKIGKIYRFELFPRENTIDGGLNRLALITMLTDDPSFKKSILEAGPEQRYRCSYEGWGCLPNVVAVIEFRDPGRRAEVTNIRMCDIIAKKYGRVRAK
jgi:hypothetical protein